MQNIFNLNVKIATPNLNRLNGSISVLEQSDFATCVGLLYYAASLDRDYKNAIRIPGHFQISKLLDNIKNIMKEFTSS